MSSDVAGAADAASRPLVRETLARLRALSAEIDRLDQAAAERYGLNRTDMRCLDLLGREGPLAPTDLARHLGYTTGGITTVLDRLERAGLARRYADPHDRRRLLVAVTDTTRERDRQVFGPLIRAAIAVLGAFDDADLGVIGAFLEQVSALTAAHTESLLRAGKDAGAAAQPPPVQAPEC
ncbi:MAG TPA: MarR family transcriptional regulator [Dehalococcoidia bacterium]|nr:MarR family transcriptional regulator [Dehalococcoidia bacterium]